MHHERLVFNVSEYDNFFYHSMPRNKNAFAVKSHETIHLTFILHDESTFGTHFKWRYLKGKRDSDTVALKDSHCLTARGVNAASARNPKQICGLRSQHELFNPSTVSLV